MNLNNKFTDTLNDISLDRTTLGMVKSQTYREPDLQCAVHQFNHRFCNWGSWYDPEKTGWGRNHPTKKPPVKSS